MVLDDTVAASVRMNAWHWISILDIWSPLEFILKNVITRVVLKKTFFRVLPGCNLFDSLFNGISRFTFFRELVFVGKFALNVANRPCLIWLDENSHIPRHVSVLDFHVLAYTKPSMVDLCGLSEYQSHFSFYSQQAATHLQPSWRMIDINWSYFELVFDGLAWNCPTVTWVVSLFEDQVMYSKPRNSIITA